MTAKISNTFILNITATDDASGNVPINRGNSIVFDSLTAMLQEYQSINGTVVLGVPGATYYQIYLRNVDPTSPLIFSYNPTFNPGLIQVAKLYPTEFLLIASASASNNLGFTAPTVTTTANTFFEYFLGN